MPKPILTTNNGRLLGRNQLNSGIDLIIAAGVVFLLDRWAGNSAVRAENAAITFQGV